MRAERRRFGGTMATWSVALALVSPVAYLALLALATEWTAPALLPRSWSLDRALNVLARRPDLFPSLALSIALSASVAAVSTAAGFLASREVAWSPWRRMLTVLAYAPFAISPVVLGASLLHVFLVLGLAGSIAGVFVAQTALCFGFAVVFFLGFWTPRMRAMEELVRTLGGTDRQAWFKALIPCARPMIVVCFVQAFLISWVQYGLTLVVGQGKVRTLPVRVYDLVFEASLSDAAVVGLVLVVPPLAMLAAARGIFGREAA